MKWGSNLPHCLAAFPLLIVHCSQCISHGTTLWLNGTMIQWLMWHLPVQQLADTKANSDLKISAVCVLIYWQVTGWVVFNPRLTLHLVLMGGRRHHLSQNSLKTSHGKIKLFNNENTFFGCKKSCEEINQTSN